MCEVGKGMYTYRLDGAVSVFTIFSVIFYTKYRVAMGRYLERSCSLSEGFFL